MGDLNVFLPNSQEGYFYGINESIHFLKCICATEMSPKILVAVIKLHPVCLCLCMALHTPARMWLCASICISQHESGWEGLRCECVDVIRPPFPQLTALLLFLSEVSGFTSSQYITVARPQGCLRKASGPRWDNHWNTAPPPTYQKVTMTCLKQCKTCFLLFFLSCLVLKKSFPPKFLFIWLKWADCCCH